MRRLKYNVFKKSKKFIKNNIENKEKSQALNKYWDILKRRYSPPQRAGKKKYKFRYQ
jgi:hypothetical protein